MRYPSLLIVEIVGMPDNIIELITKKASPKKKETGLMSGPIYNVHGYTIGVAYCYLKLYYWQRLFEQQ